MSTKDVKPTSFDLSTISPEFANLTKDLLFGDIWNREGLSQRDKSLITITSLVSQNRIEQMEYNLKKGLENGLSKDEILSAITHIAFYAGWPTAASAFYHFKIVLAFISQSCFSFPSPFLIRFPCIYYIFRCCLSYFIYKSFKF